MCDATVLRRDRRARRAISGFVRPSATSRATSNSRRGQRLPRLRRRTPRATGPAQDRLGPAAERRAADPSGDARPPRARDPRRASRLARWFARRVARREVDARPRALPDPADGPDQPATAASRRGPGWPVAPSAQRRSPRAWSSAGSVPGDRPLRGSSAATVVEPAPRRRAGSPDREVAPACPVTSEREQVGGVVDGGRRGQAVRDTARAAVAASPPQSATSASPQSAGDSRCSSRIRVAELAGLARGRRGRAVESPRPSATIAERRGGR